MYGIQKVSMMLVVCGSDRFIAAELKSQEVESHLQGLDTQWRLEPIISILAVNSLMLCQAVNVHKVNEEACGKYDRRVLVGTRNS